MSTNPATTSQVTPRSSRSRELQAILLVLLSAAGFGSLAVLAQLAYDAGVSVLGLLSGRFLVAGTVLWLIAIMLRRPLPRRRGLFIGVSLGAGYSSMALCFAASLRHIDANLADLLLFAYPALVSIGAVALGRDRWNHRVAWALAVAGTGIVLALVGSGAGIDPFGVALALAAAAIYAAYVLASSSLLGDTDPLVLAALIASGAALVFCLDAGAAGQLAPRGGFHGVALVIAVALSSSVLGTSAFMAGVRGLGPSRASVVSSAEPALTAIFAFAAFGERFGAIQLLGAGLVLVSVPILELKPPVRRRHRQGSSACTTAPSPRPAGPTTLTRERAPVTRGHVTHTSRAHPPAVPARPGDRQPTGHWTLADSCTSRGHSGARQTFPSAGAADDRPAEELPRERRPCPLS
jgi:drug/metabolite transporter (DMT)-like permease